VEPEDFAQLSLAAVWFVGALSSGNFVFTNDANQRGSSFDHSSSMMS
jgi:hypothetical protein